MRWAFLLVLAACARTPPPAPPSLPPSELVFDDVRLSVYRKGAPSLRVHAAPFAAERFDREFRAAFEEAYALWRAGAAARG